MTLEYRTLRGAEVEEALDALADLRITVFRDWPYLYDGDHAYERRYMQTYRDSPGAVLVGAFDGDRLVGAATGTPMEDHAEEFAGAFTGEELPELGEVFYCAESVLLPEYRGQGAGHAFFDMREAHARELGRGHVAFCAVMRPDDHPDRPPEARSLEPFWRGRGYRPLPEVVAEFSWKDLGDAEETRKPLQFWMKTL
ncbi:GNAT family N-acetyltransferase [Histidinibacterium aquaticum]|uniref:GNAT family N-acetyltransferase n=1 Tax=Histidinibacterium aquaticum TaxID=2613962 RepID=A0A5J5GPR5_9RHOB|nr:GNAT family N-acetyltransferase [Histidinibacterium aquaticum]KAA9010047.1 GNAT family N-acetyltransferase [Histidinibacterium aquaticum]